MQRSTFLKSMLLGGLMPWTALRRSEAAQVVARFSLSPPGPDLSEQISEPLPIASLHLESRGEELFVVARTEHGAEGRTLANTRLPYLVSLFEKLVAPFFIGKDARQLGQWIAEIYLDDRNYKYSGMPFSCCVGHAEIALWDLLGKVAQKPVYALLSNPLRQEVPVYLSSLTRNNSAEEEVARIQARLDETQTQAVKFKIGGRMKNDAASEARTQALVPLLRKTLGDHITLYADANGSYEAKKAISIGHLLEDNGVAIFEEPCPFEQYEDNQAVAKALRKIKIAGGEQDTSLVRFDWICRHRAWDILQPDVFYCGGILRLLQIANMAQEAGLLIAPHSPKADPLAAPMLHAAALIPNLYGFQEVAGFSKKEPLGYQPHFDFKGGKLAIPQGPGLGVQYDFEK